MQHESDFILQMVLGKCRTGNDKVKTVILFYFNKSIGDILQSGLAGQEARKCGQGIKDHHFIAKL